MGRVREIVTAVFQYIELIRYAHALSVFAAAPGVSVRVAVCVVLPLIAPCCHVFTLSLRR